ncbi:two-component system sporulation sensor kinase B [Bacillus oleivorans]|uniref:histidine kinase n=1 Tax=Bacillus oleivorans TaxID=1448271 RepID=A0A285D2F6_9BACI|nr:ATP-binding protein [Bacillus oleivorans]SNX74007.1 two-component system sporulation sensor kinase B [Bacillus oleivorans]
MVEKLLLHVLIILAPYLFFSIFFDNKKSKKMILLLGIINGVAAILVMCFPISNGEIIFDLRYVPLIIATLYGGPVSGGIVLLMILLKRAIVGGDALLYGYIGTILGFLLPLYINRYFMKFAPKIRIGIAILLGVWPSIFNLMIIILYHSNLGISYSEYSNFMQDFLFLGSIQIVAIGFSAVLTEALIERSMMQEKIQRAEKLNTLGELAASIAHEVRNPLTVVKGFLQLLEQEETGKKREYLILVLNELGRAEVILNDYLNFAKPKLENISEVELHDVLIKVTQLLEPLANKDGVTLQFASEEKFILKTDRYQLKQALINIIKNAIEATPAGGFVTVTATGNDNQVRLVIKDTGKGMSKEQLEHLGTVFYTTKDKGTGLGTMVSIRIIEAMKGKIEYSSKVGMGTQVTITLPVIKKIE